jgi:uncharacterized protein
MNTEDETEGAGPILDEAAITMKGLYGEKLDRLVVERLVVGVFFAGIKLSNGCAGVAYTPPEVVRNAGNRILRKETFPPIRGMRAASIAAGDFAHP